MLSAVGHPYAINADRALRKHANEQGWPVLTFSRPVALRQRTLEGHRSTLTAVAVGAGAAAAGAVLLASRWRDRRAS